jgi:monoamine oxidase
VRVPLLKIWGVEKAEVIIIGAGAAGLMAALELSKAGKKIIVLEARDRLGGRIHSESNSLTGGLTELGAEFIHGRMPLTFKLLKQYGIDFYKLRGSIWQVKKNKLEQDEEIIKDHHHQLQIKIKELKKDLPVLEFLDREFPPEKYPELRKTVTRFVEGYGAADVSRASTFAFRNDWADTKDWEQYKIKGGYGKLIQCIAGDFVKEGGLIYPEKVVTEINWKKNSVEVGCADGKTFTSKKVILTVPPGVLSDEKSIGFIPAIPEKISLAAQLGFGAVIKVLCLFRESFWRDMQVQKNLGENLDKLFFLFSEEEIPTWWTQYPEEVPLLTGWLSGKKAVLHSTSPEDVVLALSLKSLANIFKLDENFLRGQLVGSEIVNWTQDPFSRGAYVYDTVNGKEKAKELEAPLGHTLYFAGEAFAYDEGTGMVESALASGLKTSEKVISEWDA